MKSTTSLNKPQNRVEDKELTKGSLAEELEKVSRQKLVDIAKDTTTFYGEGGEKENKGIDRDKEKLILNNRYEDISSQKVLDKYRFKNKGVALNYEQLKQIKEGEYAIFYGDQDDQKNLQLKCERIDKEKFTISVYYIVKPKETLMKSSINNKLTRAEESEDSTELDILSKYKEYPDDKQKKEYRKVCQKLLENNYTSVSAIDNIVSYAVDVVQNNDGKLIKEAIKLIKTAIERKNMSENSMKKIASLENLDKSILKKLIETNNTEVITKIALRGPDYELRYHIAGNRNTSKEIIEKIIEESDNNFTEEKSWDIKIQLASNPQTPGDTCRKRYDENKKYNTNQKKEMCNALARNPSTPQRILREFAKDKNNKYWIGKLDLPKGLAENPSIPEDVANELATKGDQEILKSLTYNDGEGITQQVLEAIVANKKVGEQTKKNAQDRLEALKAQEKLQAQEANEKLLPQDTQPTIEPTPTTTTTNLSDEKPASTEKDLLNQYNTVADSTTKTTTNNAPEKETSDFIITKENIKARGGTIRAIQIGNGYWSNLDSKYRKDKGIDARQTGENAYAGIFFEKKAAEDYIAKNEKKRGGMKTITTISKTIAEKYYNFNDQENITSYDRKSQETAPSATSEVKNGGEKPLENPTVEDVKNSKDINILTVYSKSQDPKIRKAVIENNESTPLLEDFCKKETDSEVIEALIKVINQLGVYGRDKPYKGKGILQKRGLRKEQ